MDLWKNRRCLIWTKAFTVNLGSLFLTKSYYQLLISGKILIRDLEMFTSSVLNDAIFSMWQNHLEGWLKHRFFWSHPRASGLVGLGWDSGICMSKKFLGDAAAVVQASHVENHWCQGCCWCPAQMPSIHPHLL